MSKTLLHYILPLLFLLLGGNAQSVCNATPRHAFHSQTEVLTSTFTSQQENETLTFINTSASHPCNEFMPSVAEVEGKEDKQLFPKKHLERQGLHVKDFDSKTALYVTKSRPRFHSHKFKFSSDVPLTIVLGVFLI